MDCRHFDQTVALHAQQFQMAAPSPAQMYTAGHTRLVPVFGLHASIETCDIFNTPPQYRYAAVHFTFSFYVGWQSLL